MGSQDVPGRAPRRLLSLSTTTTSTSTGTGTQKRAIRTDAGDLYRLLRRLFVEHTFTLDQPADIPPGSFTHLRYRTASASASASLRSVVRDSCAQARCARAACSPALMVIRR